MRTNTPRRSPRARAISDDMLDSASIDTDVLLSQPIYGAEPVNMGGNLHKSLYEDKKVARLKKESTKKLRKSSSRTRQSRHKEKSPPSRTRSKDPGGVSPRVSRHLSYPSSYQDSSPLKPNDFYSSAEKQREARPPRYSLSPESHSHRMGGVSGRRSASPRLITEHQSPSVSRRPFFASSYRSIGSSTSTGQASGSPHKHFSPTTLRGSVPLQKAESDTESADTEREMRKSPTGIRMEKIYRDPSTMYPWKTMIQSSGSLYATGPGPSPHRVVMSPRAHDGRSRASYEGRYESPHWRSERPGRGQHVEDVMATPRPIFASSGHSGFPKSLPGYAKPPPAPESGQRRRTHRYLGTPKNKIGCVLLGSHQASGRIWVPSYTAFAGFCFYLWRLTRLTSNVLTSSVARKNQSNRRGLYPGFQRFLALGKLGPKSRERETSGTQGTRDSDENNSSSAYSIHSVPLSNVLYSTAWYVAPRGRY